MIRKEEELLNAFNILDKDGNGKISKYEFRYNLMTSDSNLNGEDIEEFIKKIGTDEEGNIDIQNCIEILMSQ